MKGQITFILVASVLLGVAELMILITLDIKLKTGFYKSVGFYDGQYFIGKYPITNLANRRYAKLHAWSASVHSRPPK